MFEQHMFLNVGTKTGSFSNKVHGIFSNRLFRCIFSFRSKHLNTVRHTGKIKKFINLTMVLKD